MPSNATRDSRGRNRGATNAKEVRKQHFVGRRASYELGARIARGGMGDVHLAEEVGSKREVAIKVLREDLRDDAVARSRFKREATIGYALSHPNLVKVIDAGGLADPPEFFVMECLRGMTLAKCLDELKDSTRHKRPRRNAGTDGDSIWKVQVGIYVARGLAMLHRARVVHRDVKPANIFLVQSQGLILEPKLLDYGIAKQELQKGLTQRSDDIGTPGYRSPEHERDAGDVDERSDQWSLAAVLLDAIAPGARPRDGRNFDREIPVDGCDPELLKVLACALDENPVRRYGSIQAFAKALEPFAGGLTFDIGHPLPLPESMVEVSWPPFESIAELDAHVPRGSPRLVWAAVAGLAVGASAAGLWSRSNPPQSVPIVGPSEPSVAAAPVAISAAPKYLPVNVQPSPPQTVPAVVSIGPTKSTPRPRARKPPPQHPAAVSSIGSAPTVTQPSASVAALPDPGLVLDP